MPEQDELDLLVRSALSSYGDPGPESDLEERVLARIASEATPVQKRAWLPWAIAFPIAAGLLLLLVYSSYRRTQPSISHAEQASLQQHSPTIAAQPNVSTEPRVTLPQRAKAPLTQAYPRMTAVTAKAAPLPKLDMFPSTQPLTAEEQALATFVAHTPKSELEALAKAQSQADAPLSIAAIKIQPLDPPDKGGN
jgi:hypothetical protein